MTPSMLPVAVDAVGGDDAPAPNVAGAHAAIADGIPVILVGPPDLTGREADDGSVIDLIEASEVIGMHDDPAAGVRRKKDSTLVRAAEAVRDGRASAMISAGNTGATMASALLRMGRIKGVKRPGDRHGRSRSPARCRRCCSTPARTRRCSPTGWCSSAQMGSIYARHRFGIESPRVGLLSIGEEASKGDSLRKEAYDLLGATRRASTSSATSRVAT